MRQRCQACAEGRGARRPEPEPEPEQEQQLHSLFLNLSSLRSSGLCFLGLDEVLDAVDHVLDEVLLGAAETSLVGNIEDALCALAVLAVDAANLHVVFIGDLVELRLVLRQLRQLDVHGRTQRGAQIGRAGGHVADMVVVRELCYFLDIIIRISKLSVLQCFASHSFGKLNSLLHQPTLPA